MARRVADAGSLAFPFLWQDAYACARHMAVNASISSISGTDFAADPAHSVPERDRRIYTKAYARRGGMRAGFEYFRAFEKDAQDFAAFARKRFADADARSDGGKSFQVSF